MCIFVYVCHLILEIAFFLCLCAGCARSVDDADFRTYCPCSSKMVFCALTAHVHASYNALVQGRENRINLSIQQMLSSTGTCRTVADLNYYVCSLLQET